MALSIGELVGYVSLDTSEAESTPGKMDGIMGKIGGAMKAGAIGAGLAAGALLAKGLMEGMENEAASDKLAASLGGTSKDAERLGNVAGQVYSNGFGVGLEDVNTALGAVVSSIKGMRNASDKDLQDMTERAMTYADVMGVDVTRAAQVAGNMVANGLARDGKQAFDLLMKTSQKVPVQLREDILDATDEYGQFFKQLGIKGPQAMGMLAEGAKKGMYGIDKAGDAIKEFTIRATDGSDLTQTAMEGIGLDADKMANAILKGGPAARKATGQIVDGLLGIKDPAKRANASIALFGTPLEDLSTKDIPVFLRSLRDGEKSLGKFGGSVKKAGAVAYDNAKTNLTMFWRTLKTGFVDFIGTKVLPVVNDLARYLATNLAPTVAKLGDWFRTKLMPALREAYEKALPGLKSAFKSMGDTIDALQPVFNMVGKYITKVWLPAMALLYGKAFPAVWKAIVVLAKVTGKSVQIMMATWRKLFGAVKVVAGFFTKTLPAFFSGAFAKVKSTTSKGVTTVVGFVKAIPGKFRSGLSSLGGMLREVFGRAMGSAKDKVTGIGSTIIGWIRDIPSRLSNLGASFATAGRNLLQDFIDGMKNAAGIITGIAGNVWDSVRGLLNGAIDRINTALEFNINTPGPGGITINPTNIPHLATGGRAYPDGRVVKIADGGQPETVLTDPQIRHLLSTARAAGVAEGRASGQGRGGPIIGTVNAYDTDPNIVAERLWFMTRTRG